MIMNDYVLSSRVYIMRYPEFLNKSDEIYLVAPSFGCTFEPYSSRLDRAIKYMSKNYRVIEGMNIRSSHICASNTKENRSLEINDAFKSNAKAVFSVGGGELMSDILEYLDYETIKNNPKWFLGYSDNTNLTYLLTTKEDIASIYSVNFPTFGLSKLHAQNKDTLNLLSGKQTNFTSYKSFQDPSYKSLDPLAGLKLNKKSKIKVYKDNQYVNDYQTEGRLIGGCLDVLLSLVGTEFDYTKDFIKRYDNENIIFFFEACNLDAPSIYRSLLQLKRASWFTNTKTIVFGIPLAAYNSSFAGMDQYNAAIMALSDLNIDIIFDVTFGHIAPTLPILNGGYVKLKTNKNVLDFEYILK